MQTPRLGLFKVLGKCPHCGNSLPINGPRLRLHCSSCQQVVELTEDRWAGLLNDYLRDYARLNAGEGSSRTIMGSSALQCTMIKLPPPVPACPGCEADWPLAACPNGAEGTISCQKCGRTTPTFPAPPWLQAKVPAAKQVFFGESDTAQESTVGEGAPQGTAVVVRCQQCQGDLSITDNMGRTSFCGYCGVQVYLPDDLWLKLHPVKVAKFWLVRFE